MYKRQAAAQYNFSSTSQAVLVTATLSSYYYSGQSPFSSATSGNAQSTGFTAFFNFVEAHKASVPSSFKAYAVSTGSNTQHLGYWTYAPTGTMYLTKTSANTAMTDNNSCLLYTSSKLILIPCEKEIRTKIFFQREIFLFRVPFPPFSDPFRISFSLPVSGRKKRKVRRLF